MKIVLFIWKFISNVPCITGLKLTSGLRVLKIKNGPINKKRTPDAIKTPKMNLSRHSWGDPRTLIV